MWLKSTGRAGRLVIGGDFPPPPPRGCRQRRLLPSAAPEWRPAALARRQRPPPDAFESARSVAAVRPVPASPGQVLIPMRFLLHSLFSPSTEFLDAGDLFRPSVKATQALCPPKPRDYRQRHVQRRLAGLVGHIVEVAVRIRLLIADGGRRPRRPAGPAPQRWPPPRPPRPAYGRSWIWWS